MMIKKMILIPVVIILVAAAGAWYYVFKYSATHHRNVENEDAVKVTAWQMVKDYETDQKQANAKYLNKAVEVQGVILSKNKDQAGNTTVIIKSGDAFSNVLCTLKPGIPLGDADSVVAVKGICSGFLTDVVLNGGIIVKRRVNSK